MKALYTYLKKHFPDNTCSVNKDINGYEGKPTERYRAYITNNILGKYDWSPEFNNIKDLRQYCKTKVEKYLKNKNNGNSTK